MKKLEGMPESYRPNNLIDFLRTQYNCKSDAQLCQRIEQLPPVISKIRHGAIGIPATMFLNISEKLDIPVGKLRLMAGLPEFTYDWKSALDKARQVVRFN